MADRARQTLVGFTLGTVGFCGAGILVSSQLASEACFAAMTVSGFVAIVVYMAQARSYDPYREKAEE